MLVIERCASDNLTLIIDRLRDAFITSESSKVNDLTLAPKNSMKARYAQQRIGHAGLCESNNLPVRIYSEGLAVAAARECAEVSRNTFLPSDRMQNEAVWGVEADGVNNRSIRSASNGSLTIQQGVGVARKVEKEIGSAQCA